MIECRKMTIESRDDAFSLLRSFLCEDEYYLNSSAVLQDLKQELLDRGVLRIDTSVHLQNDRAKRFYQQQGFQRLDEEKLACVL